MKKIYLLLLSLPFVLWGCPKAKDPTPTPVVVKTPKACFTVNKSLFDSGEVITFTDCSTDAGVWLWDLGDGPSSQSTLRNPTHVYSANRATYHITYRAYSADQSKHVDSSANITEGFRQIDSVVLLSIPNSPNYKSGDEVLFQMGSSVDVTAFSAPSQVVTAFPATFVFSPGIKITSAINSSWAGHLFNNATKQSIIAWGAARNIFFSRGLNNSPIVYDDGFGYKMNVYYHLIAK